MGEKWFDNMNFVCEYALAFRGGAKKMKPGNQVIQVVFQP